MLSSLNSAVTGPLLADGPQRAVLDKARQNAVFKLIGMTMALFGAAGFAPSIVKAALTGQLWSVSHNSPHTNNTWLVPHLFGMIVWLVLLFVQFHTGGVPEHNAVHRASGFVAVVGLAVGMSFATANELDYDSGGGLVYTLCLAVGATVNALLGVCMARAKRFPEHKDFMLMATMFTLDPAIHRLSMWCIRWIASLDESSVDPMLLLILGKLPTNVILFSAFGAMAVYGGRVNCVTVPNIGFNAVSLVLVSGFAFTQTTVASPGGASLKQVAPSVWVAVAVADTIFVVVVAALLVVERREQGRHGREDCNTRPGQPPFVKT